MFRKNTKSLLVLSLLAGLGLPALRLKADIINDIDQLEKKPEKKKETQDTESPDKPAQTPHAKRPSKPTKPQATETDADKDGKVDLSGKDEQPDKSKLIPEPQEETIAPPRPLKKGGKTSKGKEHSGNAPVHWSCQGTSTFSKDSQVVTLKKDVVITQDDMRLQSDDAKVTFFPKDSKASKAAKALGPAGSSPVKVAVLEGRVAMARYADDPDDRMNAKSDKATFDNAAQTVTLEGNARLWRSGNLIKGEKIVYDLATGQGTILKPSGVAQPQTDQQAPK